MKRFISKWLRVSGVLSWSIVCLQASPPPVSTPGTTSGSPSQPLWLEIAGVSNEVVRLILHGTAPSATYEVQSKEDLINAWGLETTLLGAEGMDSTAFEIAMSGRTNSLFVRTRFDPDEEGAGLPLQDLQLWLRADAGVVPEGTNGAVSLWQDQSGHGNDATQASASFRPQRVGGGINGRSTVRFTPSNFLRFPDFLSTNTAGEVFIVLKTATPLPSSNRALWRFGQASGGYYPSYVGSGGYISASFGRTSIIPNTGTPRQRIDQFHLYNASTEPHRWVSRINGMTSHETGNPSVGFSSQPYLGYNGSGAYLDGDVAELMLFHRVLTLEEREDVGCYLNQKYQWITAAPETPEALTAVAIAPNQISLSWTHAPAAETTVYVVERKPDAGGAYIVVAEIRDATACLDRNVAGDVSYGYRLKARNYAGESAYSAEVSVTTPAHGAPVPMADLQLWLKADAGVLCQGTNGTVKIWQDQSGNGHHATQANSTAQPRWTGTNQAGRPVVRFDGINDFLHLPDFLSANVEGEVFVVLKAATNAPAGSRGLWHFGSAAGGYYPASGSAGGYISASFGRSTLVINSGTPSRRLDELHLYNADTQPGHWASRINGSPHYSTTNNSVGFTPTPYIGRNRANNFPNYFDGDIAELMGFDRVLTPGERGAVGAYLNSRHAVVNLPTGAIALTAQTLSATQVALSWTQQEATNPALYTYTVERREGMNGSFLAIAQVSGDARYYDEEVAAGTAYDYRVRNTLAPGSDPSNAATATTLTSGSAVPLARIALWFRAGDLMLTNGESISQWGDFHDPARQATQGDPAWQPHWRAGNFNGCDSVEFGGGTFLELPATLSNATSAEAFVVLRAGTIPPATHRGLWQFNPTGPTWFPDTNGVVQDAFGSTTANENLPPLPHLTNALIYNVSAAAGLWQSRMNGPLKQWVTTNTVEFAGVPLLGRSTGGASEGFSGDIAELIIFDRLLTLEEQQAIRDGLAAKYGIPLTLPAIPAGFMAGLTNNTERLISWTPLTGSENGLESYFVLERQADPQSAFLPIATATRTQSSWLDASGLTEINYRYRLRAINDAGDTLSEAVSAALIDTDRDGLPDVLEEIPGTDVNGADSDGDGLPDGWEIIHGLNPLRDDGIHGASGDLDNDGHSNFDEYQNGTDPADGAEAEDPFIRLNVHRPN